MTFLLKPWQLYFLALAGLVNRHQQELIEYLRTENQVLREKFGIPRGDMTVFKGRWPT